MWHHSMADTLFGWQQMMVTRTLGGSTAMLSVRLVEYSIKGFWCESWSPFNMWEAYWCVRGLLAFFISWQCSGPYLAAVRGPFVNVIWLLQLGCLTGTGFGAWVVPGDKRTHFVTSRKNKNIEGRTSHQESKWRTKSGNQKGNYYCANQPPSRVSPHSNSDVY